MKLTKLLYQLARKSRDVKVITSGDPVKMAKRVANKAIGRKVVKKLWR